MRTSSGSFRWVVNFEVPGFDVDLDPEEHGDMWLHAGYGKRDVAPLSELLSETPEAFLGSWVPAEEFLAALRPDEEDGESGERAS